MLLLTLFYQYKYCGCNATYYGNTKRHFKVPICERLINGHTTSNPRRFGVDIASIRRRPNFNEFPRHFRVLFWCNFDSQGIHVVSTYFFQRNFAGRKIYVISTYFFWYNFDGRKIHVVSRYFYRCNFAGRKIHIVSTYFFPCNFDGRNMQVVFTYFFST